MLGSFVENYFPHLWKRPAQAEQMYQVLSKRPLEGGKSYAKQRTFALISDGLKIAAEKPELGLELVSTNPIDISLLKIREMDRAIMARNFLDEMKASNHYEYVKVGEAPPAGWVQINDKVSTVMSKDPQTKQLVVHGHYYAPEPAARVIDNYLSPSLRGNDAFRKVQTFANSLNQAQLGFSAYHLGMTASNAVISSVALAIEKGEHAHRTGNAKLAASALKDVAMSVPRSIRADVAEVAFEE